MKSYSKIDVSYNDGSIETIYRAYEDIEIESKTVSSAITDGKIGGLNDNGFVILMFDNLRKIQISYNMRVEDTPFHNQDKYGVKYQRMADTVTE